MKCPYRKAVYIYRNSHDSETERHEEYEDCYKNDCPFYVPERQWSDFVVSEACGKTISNETIKDLLKDLKEGEKNESDHL